MSRKRLTSLGSSQTGHDVHTATESREMEILNIAKTNYRGHSFMELIERCRAVLPHQLGETADNFEMCSEAKNSTAPSVGTNVTKTW